MSRPSIASLIGRILAGVVVLAAGAVLVLALATLLSSRFSGPERDPHGYGLIFGTLMAAVSGLVVAAVLPLSLPRHRVGGAYPVTMASYGLLFCGIVALALTA